LTRSPLASFVVLAVAIAATIAYWQIAIPVIAILLVLFAIHRRTVRQLHLEHVRSVYDLYALNPERFEREVLRILHHNGWKQLAWVGGSGDMGADVTGIDPMGRKSIVQAKRWKPGTAIGSPVIQTLLGSQLIYKAEHSVLVTTASFTPAAMSLASLMGVELVDGAALVAMAQRGAVARA
jgi:restriction system protein